MIITRSPLRISIFGGGTDLINFYSQHGSKFISLAIDKVFIPSFTTHSNKNTF